LCEGFVEHGAAPDDRLSLIDEEAHGHEFDAGGVDGFDAHDAVALGIGEFFGAGAAFGVHEVGDAGAVDISVHQTNTTAERVQCAGESGSDGAFSDATFAAPDGDNVMHVEPDASAGIASADGRLNFDAGLEFRSGELDALADGGFELFGFWVGWCGEFDADAGIGAVDEGVADHPQFTERFLGAGFDDIGDEDLELFGCWHVGGAFGELSERD
jgi:hypothetical protein